MPMETAETTTLLKALADETRLGIVRKFADTKCRMHICDLIKSCTSLLQLSQPTMSHHIAKLVQAKVLVEEKDARQKVYRLNTAYLKEHGINPEKL